MRRYSSLIRNSDLFDAAWYLSSHPDVAQSGIDPERHYLQFGGFEGRDPGPYFSSSGYLSQYEDVRISGENPLIHYLLHGRGEGRKAHPDQSLQGAFISRKQKILSRITPALQDGLEFGPLFTPIVTKAESAGRVHYVDYLTTEGLKEHYRNDPAVNCAAIVDIDFVWGEQRLSEIVNGRRYDYAIASHVIEHLPDILGWLKEVKEVLVDNGVLSLAIPDKRFEFDYMRDVSTPGMLIEAYLLKKMSSLASGNL